MPNEVRNILILLYVFLGFCVSYYAGWLAREIDLLKKMKATLQHNEHLARRADSWNLDESDVHRPSYEVGFFHGRHDSFMEILDILDRNEKKKKIEERREMRNDRRRDKDR